MCHAWREVGHASTSGVWWFRPQNHRRGTRMEYATREWFGGLGLKTIGWTGLRVWASKPGRRFRGGMDGTWRHRVRVEAKLSHEGCGGRRMKITSGWTITPSGYVVRLKICKSKTGIM
jgi:hypothetical protein